ncbi:MAG: hypothetical protein GY754_02270 [bacterium]|nr:hypothetical protein [bacterium]
MISLKRSLIVCMGIIILLSTALLAQDEPVEPGDAAAAKEDPGVADTLTDLGLSGKMYIQWGADLNGNDMNNSFSMERMYLTYQRGIGGPVSIKITTDVARVKAETSDGATKVTGNSYELYVKNAYFQIKEALGPITVSSQMGIIGTPNIGMVDKMMDLRWVYNNYTIDKSSSLLKTATASGPTLDYSADLGLNLSVKVFDMVTVTADVTNGEGYKNIEDTYDGKTLHGMVSVTPVKGLYINGYSKWGKTADNTYSYYLGGGAGYVTETISGGGNFIMPFLKSTGTTVKYQAIEAWVRLNFEAIIGLPFLLANRVAYGRHTDDDQIGALFVGGGAGYRVNKHFRALLYTEYSKAHETGATSDINLYVKTESKF